MLNGYNGPISEDSDADHKTTESMGIELMGLGFWSQTS